MSLNAVFSERGIFDRAEKAGNKYSEAKAKEILETVLMADAQTEKYTNLKYNQDDFLDELIQNKIPGSDIKGDVVIIDGWAFELDRSVPKIVTPLGKADELVFPTVTVSEVQLADNYRTATFTVTALEETNGISKIEIWLNGEKLDAYDKTYTNIKTEISEDFTVNRNGTYTVKVYGKLMISKTVKVEGIVPAVKFSPNGNTEWKKEHSCKITIEQTGETVTEIKYLWKTGENEPQASEFIETCTEDSTITGKELTGKYHLWVLLKTNNDKTSICGSEEFYFDNEGPKIKLFTSTKYSIDGITLTVTAQDTGAGITRLELYVDDELKDTQTYEATTENITITSKPITGLTAGEHNCKVVIYDLKGNNNYQTISGITKMYSWVRWSLEDNKEYVDGVWSEPISKRIKFSKYSMSYYSKWYIYQTAGGYYGDHSGEYDYWSDDFDMLWRSDYPGLTERAKRTFTSEWILVDNDNHYDGNLYKGISWKVDGEYVELTLRKKETILKHNYSKGKNYLGRVTSGNQSEYPQNGQQDGYWYVYEGLQ